jgi:hypothetical protein
MALAASWKTAKTAFENATNKKKPSEKFLGVFRKGSGIETALKSVDDAKTADDLKKALLKFNTAYTAYIKELDKTAADPKTVPAADKAAYVAEIKKLKTALEKIEADGEGIAAALGTTKGKVAVDSNQLKEANTKVLKEAEEHLALRERAGKEAQGLVAKFKAELAKAETNLNNAKKQLEEAKKAGKSGNTMGHQVAVGVIHRYVEEITKIAGPVRSTYDAKVSGGQSEMMQARMDFGGRDKLPESMRQAYLTKSGAAFKILGGATAELTSLLGSIENKVHEVEAVLAQAEGAGSTMKSPKEYLGKLNKLLADVTKEAKDASIKGDRIIKGNEQVAEQQKKPKDEALRWYDLQEGQWKRYEPDMKVAAQRLKALKAQATAIPEVAREDGAIDKLVTQVEKVADDGLDYVDTVNLAGGQLMAKMNLQRNRLK